MHQLLPTMLQTNTFYMISRRPTLHIQERNNNNSRLLYHKRMTSCIPRSQQQNCSCALLHFLPQMHNYLCTTFKTTTKRTFLKYPSCEITHKTCLPQTPSGQNHKQPTSCYLAQIVYK